MNEDGTGGVNGDTLQRSFEVRRRKENWGAAVWRKEDTMHIGPRGI